jgi:tetratricopeptide (TPR) repeat protein
LSPASGKWRSSPAAPWLDESVPERAGKVVALSRWTFTHEMARVVLLEQLYRAFTIIKGKTYHIDFQKRTRMRFIVTLLLIGVAVFVMLLREFNPDMITINLLPSKSYEIAKSTFFLLSLATGAGFIFALYFTRDLKRFLRGLRVQREQKKRLKVQELYTKGLNSMLAKRNFEAVGHFQKVLALDPNRVDTLLRMGISQLREKSPQEAILVHQKALGLNP